MKKNQISLDSFLSGKSFNSQKDDKTKNIQKPDKNKETQKQQTQPKLEKIETITQKRVNVPKDDLSKVKESEKKEIIN